MQMNPHLRRATSFLWRIFHRHRYLIVGIVACAGALWWLLACASTRIEPASNSAKVDTNRTPTSETVRIRVGGEEVKTEAR